LLKIQIDGAVCQARTLLRPRPCSVLFGEDQEGYGKVLGDGVVPLEKQEDARRAALNCPEDAVSLTERA
jgi:ferredoxin